MMTQRIIDCVLSNVVERHNLNNYQENSVIINFHPSNEVILVEIDCVNEYGSRYGVATGKVFFSRLPQDVRCELIRMGAGRHIF